MTATIVERDIIQNIVYFIPKSGQLIYFRLQLLKTVVIYSLAIELFVLKS